MSEYEVRNAVTILERNGYFVSLVSGRGAYCIRVPGKVIGKKNAKKVARRGNRCMLIAKDEWVDFFDGAMDAFRIFHLQEDPKGLPIRIPQAVHVWYHYHPPSHVRPDTSAIKETVGDIIEVARFRPNKKTGVIEMSRDGGGIIEDDKQILNWDGSRLMEINKLEPYLLIWVKPYDPPPGEYRLLVPKKKKAKSND